jgi:hypothetical protein
MACYHFTIKVDKAPNGNRIDATQHVDYIQRDGKYKSIDLERELKAQEFTGNILSGAVQNNVQSITPMYKSIYGSIRENKGIETTKNASIMTVDIALTLALKKYGSPLSIDGDTTFKAQAVSSAATLDLPIHFADSQLESALQKLKEGKIHENRGRFFDSPNRSGSQKLSQSSFKSGCQAPPPQRRNSMSLLSVRDVVSDTRTFSMLLPSNVHEQLDNRREDANSPVRRATANRTSAGRRIRAAKTAHEIMHSSSKTFGADHANYINRNEQFAARGGCVYSNHHLPNWAKDNPKTFFQAADKYESVNGTRYREIEFALPNELTLEAQKEIINEFLDRHLKDFYYAYAIHDKVGSMSNGEHNTHVHIMFSERKIDAAEREQERSAKVFFSYPKRSPKTLAERRLGGAKKDRKWSGNDRGNYLCEMRKDFAMIQNAALELHGFAVRVDYRSLAAQKEAAIARGDLSLASALDRMPEKHLGPEIALKKAHPDVIDLQKYRQAKAEHRQLLYAADLLESSENKSALLKDSNENANKVKKLTQNELVKNTLEDVSLLRAKNDLLDAIRVNAALKNIVIWNADAQIKAIEKFLTKQEMNVYFSIKKLQKEKDELSIFAKRMEKPFDYRKSDLTAYNNVQKELQAKNAELASKILMLKLPMQKITEKLSTSPLKEKIQTEIRFILANDKPNKQALKESNEKVDYLATKLRTLIHEKELALAAKEKAKPRFSALEIKTSLELSYKNLQTQRQKNSNQLKSLRSKMITPGRAAAMAKNIYTKGAFNSLGDEFAALKKDSIRLDKAREEYANLEDAFSFIEKPRWYQNKNDYVEKEKHLLETKSILDQRENDFKTKENALQSEENRLNALCSTDSSKQKIAEITAGILIKNQPITNTYNQLFVKSTSMKKDAAELSTIIKSIENQVACDKGENITYQVKGMPSASNDNQMNTIARALTSRPDLAQLIAKFKDDEELYEGMDRLDIQVALRNRELNM